MNQSVLLELPLKSCHTLKNLTILHTTPTQMKILITPLILMATAIVKIQRQHFIAQLLMRNMTPGKKLILVTSRQWTYLQCLTYTTLPTLKPKNTVTGTTPNLTLSPQLGYLTFMSHVTCFYFVGLSYLDYKNSLSPLDTVDNNLCVFLQGMIQTYHDLSSLDEPDIFDITKDQK